jgi:hypothetical protein
MDKKEALKSIMRKNKLLALSANGEPQIANKLIANYAIWKDINKEFGVTKMRFGRRINFIKDPFKRTVIFRDVEQAFILATSGFSKPAVILAGGVIEELLRLFLKQKGISPQKPLKDDFNGYIQTCEQEGLGDL